MPDELFEWGSKHYRPEYRPEKISRRATCDTRGCMKDPTHKVVWPDGMHLPYCKDHAMMVAALSETAKQVEEI